MHQDSEFKNPNLLKHVSFLTGDCASHRIDLLAPQAVAACRSLLPDGGQVPLVNGFCVEIHGSTFGFTRLGVPIAFCGIGRGLDEMWDLLWDMQYLYAPVNAQVPGGRWLGEVLFPGIGACTREEISWIADFSLTLAAAILAAGQETL